MKRIFLILVAVVALAVGIAWYMHWSKIRAMNNGEVYVRDQPGDNAKSSSPQTPPIQSASAPEVATANGGDTSIAGPSHTQTQQAIPASDTISRNPPNGKLFGANGKFALYRQGDITWRLNTDTGEACILFATDQQWTKTRIYQHGCGAG